ncbi:hypothetical protein GcC1_028034 [Golovinomyces cichoracearum]|uniref:Uncharacterized protein n=1 Tax=Golovinomyces cichoracearum TaxID=62708 RepID=A0A420J347_9PEZI|nr:hypothetical protein GcC1_028034 [Golovinomyces cichoracearum]
MKFATNPRAIPKDKSIKNSDVVDYYTRNARLVYPDVTTSTTMIIPNVVIYHEIFKRYDKSNVYVGIPQSFARWLSAKLASAKIRCNFEDQGVSADEEYWWTCCSFTPVEENKEYIFIVEDRRRRTRTAQPLRRQAWRRIEKGRCEICNA